MKRIVLSLVALTLLLGSCASAPPPEEAQPTVTAMLNANTPAGEIIPGDNVELMKLDVATSGNISVGNFQVTWQELKEPTNVSVQHLRLLNQDILLDTTVEVIPYGEPTILLKDSSVQLDGQTVTTFSLKGDVAGEGNFSLTVSFEAYSPDGQMLSVENFPLTGGTLIVPGTPEPSITITSIPEASGGKVTTSVGETITITGHPLNLPGMMGTDYTRSFFFDTIFNGCLTNTDWEITGTAKIAGVSNFYIEVYTDNYSKIYRSNIIEITVENPPEPSVTVTATLDGNPWEGSVIFDISRNADFDGMDATGQYQVPKEFTGLYSDLPGGANVYIRLRQPEGFQSGPETAYLYGVVATGYGESDGSWIGPCPTPATFIFVFKTLPSITVLSPNGGEEWIVGETERVSWQSSGVEYVRIYIYDDTISGSGCINYIYDGALPADTEYYDWTIGQNQLPGGTSLPRQYKMRIDGLNKTTVGSTVLANDHSDSLFDIVAPPPPPDTGLTVEELQAQINALLAQLSVLQEELAEILAVEEEKENQINAALAQIAALQKKLEELQ